LEALMLCRISINSPVLYIFKKAFSIFKKHKKGL
jgi:hypothetical protein